MSVYRNMKIRKKLMCSFLAIAVVAAVVGGVGTMGMFRLNKNEGTLYREGVESLTGINGMYAVIVEQRLQLQGIMLNIDDAEKVNASIENLRTSEAEFDELYDLYLGASSGTDTKENELLKRTMDIYNGQLKELKERMIAALQSGNKATAREAFAQTADVAEQATGTLYEMVLYGNERAADIYEEDVSTAINLIVILGALTAVSVFLAVLLGLYNAKIIAKPVSNIADAAQELSMGDVEIDISVDSHDEIGDLAKAFGRMIESIRMQADILGAVADGDYTVSVPIRSEKDVINKAILNLVNDGSRMMGELKTSSNQVTSASGQIAQAAQGLASGSSEQAASIEEFTATLVELQEKTNRNAESSTKALKANEKAATQIMDSMRSMDDMLKAMSSIAESSDSITKVIKVIDDIAFQTNILALNAAVEAARAGHHGKGFAVVADEVRNLASKSAAAAKETAALIEGSSERVDEGNRIVTKTKASLEMVAENVQGLARMVGEVAGASAEQAQSIHEIHQGIEQISTVVQANSATAEQSAAAAQEMSAQAVLLDEIVAKFKLEQAVQQKHENSGPVEDVASGAHRPGNRFDKAGFALAHGK